MRNPRGKHLPKASAKDQRQYTHILKSEMKSGRTKKTAKRIAAATVRKGQAKRRSNGAQLSASEIENRIKAYKKAASVATDKKEKAFIVAQLRRLTAQLKKVQAANKKAFESNPRRTPPSVRVKAAKRKGRNPQFKVEAKVAPGIRSFTSEFKVPSRTLANLAMRGYVQEMGGGNPNAYTYKSTKLGLAKWRVEAIPKVKASSATVKALTAGSAVRKFKKTLAGRGRFKTPRGAYEISVQRNPKSTGFALAGQISRKLDALKKQPLSMRRSVSIQRLEKALEKAYTAAVTAQRAEEEAMYAAPRTFSTTKRKGGGVRKKKNPYSYEEEMRRLQGAMDQIQAKRLAAYKAGTLTDALEKKYLKQLDNINRQETKIFNRERADLAEAMKEDFRRDSIRAAKIDARREKAIAKKRASKKANPRKRIIRRKRNDGASQREDFAGTFTGYKDLNFPKGSPHGLWQLGPLISITTSEAGKINFAKGAAVLSGDKKKKLHVGSTQEWAAIYSDGKPLRNANLGKIKQIEYWCPKPHLGNEYSKNTHWFHDFESPLPRLHTDAEGLLLIKGGSYTITPEGITG